ncbi:MAG: hypothetical protein HYZ20_14350 [Burkholderiales bacterium]|nr:hypothetical protein [Burkholderiales bacterium]
MQQAQIHGVRRGLPAYSEIESTDFHSDSFRDTARALHCAIAIAITIAIASRHARHER